MGREAFSVDRVWSGGLLGGPGVVRRPSRWTGCGQKAFPVHRVWSEGHPGWPGEVSRSGRTGSGPVALLVNWEWLEALPEGQEWSGGLPRSP